MVLEAMEITDKRGRTVVFRSAEPSDAADLIRYMRETTAETPYLIREPDEFALTAEQEEAFLKKQKENPRALMLLAFLDGEHIGNCSLSEIGSYRRYAHRCEVAIALYQKYCGVGIGAKMMTAVLAEAKRAGYEQAELEVVAANRSAVALYHKLGFTVCGTLPRNIKYRDGSYADAYCMMKPL